MCTKQGCWNNNMLVKQRTPPSMEKHTIFMDWKIHQSQHTRDILALFWAILEKNGTHTVWSHNCTVRHLWQRNKNSCFPQKTIHVYRRFILNSPNLEITKMSLNGWMAKFHIMGYYSGVLGLEEKKKALLKGHVLCNVIYITFLKWQNHTHGKQAWLPGVRDGGGRCDYRGSGRQVME